MGRNNKHRGGRAGLEVPGSTDRAYAPPAALQQMEQKLIDALEQDDPQRVKDDVALIDNAYERPER